MTIEVPYNYPADSFVGQTGVTFKKTTFEILLDGVLYNFSDNIIHISGNGKVSEETIEEASNMKCPCRSISDITEIYFEGNETFSLGTFGNMKNLKIVEFNNEGNQNINDNCFNGCSLLTNVTLPINLKRIGIHAFNGTSIENINIRSSQIIDKECFSYCKSLKTVWFSSVEQQNISSDIFYECRLLTDVYYCSSQSPLTEQSNQIFTINSNGSNVSRSDEVRVHVVSNYDSISFVEKNGLNFDSPIVSYEGVEYNFNAKAE